MPSQSRSPARRISWSRSRSRSRQRHRRRHRSPLSGEDRSPHREHSPRRDRSPRRERSPRRQRSPRRERSPLPPRDRSLDHAPGGRRSSPGRPRSRSPEYHRYERPQAYLPPPPPQFQRPYPPVSHQQYQHQASHQQYQQHQDGDGDEELRAKAESLSDFRRLKRIKLWESNANSIWRNTPSPPPDSREDASGAKEEKEGADAHPNGEASEHHKGHRHHKHGDQEAGAAAAAAEAAAATAAGTSGGSSDEEPEGEDAQPPEQEAAEEVKQEEMDNEAIRAVNQEEANLFSLWLEEQKALAAALDKARAEAEEANSIVGPQLPAHMTVAGRAAANYGGALLPGEGSAMAAYVQSGKRIPRRGEIALTAEQIERFEGMGYIMSGSRHSRMNAVRIRKENQIYTAEEKAALAMFNFEENKRKEAKILEDMKRLVDRTMGPGA